MSSFLQRAGAKFTSIVNANKAGLVRTAAATVGTVVGGPAGGAAALAATRALQKPKPKPGAPVANEPVLGNAPGVEAIGNAVANAEEARQAAGVAPIVKPTVLGIPRKTAAIAGAALGVLLLLLGVWAVARRGRA